MRASPTNRPTNQLINKPPHLLTKKPRQRCASSLWGVASATVVMSMRLITRTCMDMAAVMRKAVCGCWLVSQPAGWGAHSTLCPGRQQVGWLAG